MNIASAATHRFINLLIPDIRILLKLRHVNIQNDEDLLEVIEMATISKSISAATLTKFRREFESPRAVILWEHPYHELVQKIPEEEKTDNLKLMLVRQALQKSELTHIST